MLQFDKDKIKEYFTTFSLFRNRNQLYFGVIFFILFFSLLWVFYTSGPKSNDEIPFYFVIEKGESLHQISEKLEKQKVIRSKTIFNTLVILKKGDTSLVSGEYLFHENPTVFEVTRRITQGDYGINSKNIRIPEGATMIQIGELFEQEYISFNKEAFYQLAEGKEGMLFPDTYTFRENVKAHEVLATLLSNFDKKYKKLLVEIQSTPFSKEDVVNMASIIEKEATADGRQEVSNILWKRLGIEMPLQVDATFVYERGKGTFDLTMDDLTEDSPYNTYINIGLPPTPISNPSYEALKAAANPEKTENLYFLTGHDGNMYYAKTYEDHMKNKRRYLWDK